MNYELQKSKYENNITTWCFVGGVNYICDRCNNYSGNIKGLKHCEKCGGNLKTQYSENPFCVTYNTDYNIVNTNEWIG